MRKGRVYIYYGEGNGKTALSIGKGIKAISEGLSVVMIQFLHYNNIKEISQLKIFEPDFRIFKFEKIRENISTISDKEIIKEIYSEVRNAFKFATKIVETGECDVLILDGITDAIKNQYINQEEFLDIILKKEPYMDIIITGNYINERIKEEGDYIYKLIFEKNK